jgi:galactokinase
VAGQAGELIEKFKWKFPKAAVEPRVFRAPGRINLIGDHTDYNDGFVLPMAIELACWIATAGNELGLLRFHADDLQKYHEVRLEDLDTVKPRGDWSDYVVGVAVELRKAGVPLRGQDLVIESSVPMGAGLSSSAAIEVVTALALMGDYRMDRSEIALLCQRAENQFAGTPCGIMDQFAIVHGRDGGAIRLDCRSLEFEAVPLPRGVAIVAVNSMVKRELGTSQYRVRRSECDSAVKLIGERFPGVRSLRDVTPDMLQVLPPGPPLMRARHVLSENLRVTAFLQAARQSNPSAMGSYLMQSHRSLKEDYEVSCAELDFLVESAMDVSGVYGARMTGGGFGGCTVNLLNRDAVPEFRGRIRSIYQYRYGVDPQVIICEPAAGASQFMM